MTIVNIEKTSTYLFNLHVNMKWFYPRGALMGNSLILRKPIMILRKNKDRI